MTDKSVSTSLRELANFLDAHPDINVTDQNITLLKYVSERGDLTEIARLGAWRKVYTASWFELRRDFGNGIVLQVYTDRQKVCRRVVLGTRLVPAIPEQPERTEEIVEWICEDEPLLAGAKA